MSCWDEALDLAAAGWLRIRDRHGPRALAGFGSAKGSNEEAYLFQKLVRTGFRSHNVDHCTRLCHASSVAALLEGIGSAAVSNPVMDVMQAELVIVIGANPSVNYPVAATWIKNAVREGTRLVLCDPRHSELARHAWRHLAFKPDTDVALLNALLHVIVTEGLVDEAFIAGRTEGFEALEPDPVALIHPLDLEALGARPGEVITLQSRRGEVSLYARADESTPRGAVFVAFCYYEAAANRLTNPALDPVAKIPELKHCAVRVRVGGTPPQPSRYREPEAAQPWPAGM